MLDANTTAYQSDCSYDVPSYWTYLNVKKPPFRVIRSAGICFASCIHSRSLEASDYVSVEVPPEELGMGTAGSSVMSRCASGTHSRNLLSRIETPPAESSLVSAPNQWEAGVLLLLDSLRPLLDNAGITPHTNVAPQGALYGTLPCSGLTLLPELCANIKTAVDTTTRRIACIEASLLFWTLLRAIFHVLIQLCRVILPVSGTDASLQRNASATPK